MPKSLPQSCSANRHLWRLAKAIPTVNFCGAKKLDLSPNLSKLFTIGGAQVRTVQMLSARPDTGGLWRHLGYQNGIRHGVRSPVRSVRLHTFKSLRRPFGTLATELLLRSSPAIAHGRGCRKAHRSPGMRACPNEQAVPSDDERDPSCAARSGGYARKLVATATISVSWSPLRSLTRQVIPSSAGRRAIKHGVERRRIQPLGARLMPLLISTQILWLS